VEPLGVEGRVGVRAEIPEAAHHAVSGDGEGAEEGQDGFGLVLVVAALGVEQKEGGHGVHQKRVNAGGAETRIVLFGPLGEVVVRAPEVGRRRVEGAAEGTGVVPVQRRAEHRQRIVGEQSAVGVPGGRLRDAEGRKVVGPQAEEGPGGRRHGRYVEPHLKAPEAVAEGHRVIGCGPVGLQQIAGLGQKARRPEKERFSVPRILHCAEGVGGRALGERRHRRVVLRVPQSREEPFVQGRVQRGLVRIGKLVALSGQALSGKVVNPGPPIIGRHLVPARRAGERVVIGPRVEGVEQFAKRGVEARVEHDLGQGRLVGAQQAAGPHVGVEGDVEHHAVVARVGVVLMLKPPAGGVVDLDVAAPVHSTDADVSILKVRPGIGILGSRIESPNGRVVRRRELIGCKPLAGPEVLDERLGHVGRARRRFVELLVLVS
jgi:hypothetical protein